MLRLKISSDLHTIVEVIVKAPCKKILSPDSLQTSNYETTAERKKVLPWQWKGCNDLRAWTDVKKRLLSCSAGDRSYIPACSSSQTRRQVVVMGPTGSRHTYSKGQFFWQAAAWVTQCCFSIADAMKKNGNKVIYILRRI